MKQPKLSHIIQWYITAAEARRISPRTLADYANTFRKLQCFIGDPAFVSIDVRSIEQFFAQLPTSLSDKTVLNYHIGLSALWTWAIKAGYADRHVLREITPPDPEERVIVPFTQEEVRLLLNALDRSRVYIRPGKRECSNRQDAGIITRNRAIILVLLDTGLRASELVSLQGKDVDMRNRRIHVVNGKGDKDRMIPFSANTAQAIQRYLLTRADDSINDPLFVTHDGLSIDRITLRRTLHRLGERAGVADVHPHRFRHTFAIQFLRNGGNMYVLQMLLGHSTLEMCKKYLLLAQTDADETHKRASPVSNWRL